VSVLVIMSGGNMIASPGTVDVEFMPEGVTVKKRCYKEILCCVRSSIRCKHPELWAY
jgi:hypothetical protein